MFHSEVTDPEQSPAIQPRGSAWRRFVSRATAIAIGVSFLAVLVYCVVFSVRIANGVTRSADMPTHNVRLQILNAAGTKGLTYSFASQLTGYSDGDLEIAVVDTGYFDVTTVPASFVISREEEPDAARLLAQKLGLDPSMVVTRPLADNRQLVTATLVLGEDYQKIPHLTRKPKEK